jgi:NADH-quinone oxidoreductase subunit F
VILLEKLISKYFIPGKTFSLDDYIKDGGYQAAKTVFEKLTPKDLLEEVKKSNLRGLGGAGFLTGMKWSFVPQNTGKPVYLVVNCDEGEPGTFKDKYILNHAPHLLLEGIIIAAYANNVRKAFVYIRGEYTGPYRKLNQAIEEAKTQGFLGQNIFGKNYDLEVVLHRGAGAYICGEETGLLESLEGKKGLPRLKPPFPAVVGLFGCPTVINNVETLSYLPFIINRGAEWFAGLGSSKNGGMRLFGVSGNVKRPGVYELPLGISLKKIIYDYAGGIPGDKKIKAVVPGGLSSAVLTPDQLDVGMDFDQLRAIGTMAGSAGVIVMDETVSMVEALFATMRFYAHESCGQCSPCREGTGWVYRILSRIVEGRGRLKDIDNLLDIGSFMTGTTICALADGAAMPLLSYLQKFRGEFEEYICSGRKTSLEQAGHEEPGSEVKRGQGLVVAGTRI